MKQVFSFVLPSQAVLNSTSAFLKNAIQKIARAFHSNVLDPEAGKCFNSVCRGAFPRPFFRQSGSTWLLVHRRRAGRPALRRKHRLRGDWAVPRDGIQRAKGPCEKHGASGKESDGRQPFSCHGARRVAAPHPPGGGGGPAQNMKRKNELKLT